MLCCRSNCDVTSLCVEGELVDVHLTGADHPNFLFRNHRSIVGHVHVGIRRGLILLRPETTKTHTKSFHVKFVEHFNLIHINHKLINR